MTIGQKTAKHSFLTYPALVFGALFLLIPAFINHYPLVNPDSATYLASGFKPETPFDRPITYGLLIRLCSINGLSLWSVVFAQGYLVSWLLFKIIKSVSGKEPYLLKALLVVFLLSVCSSLSWLVSQVQPDVFTSIGFLCVVLLLMGKENRKTNLLLYVLFFIAVAVHLSHPLLFAGSLVIIFFFRRLFAANEAYGLIGREIVALILISLAGYSFMGSALSKSKHVFFVGSLLEKGLLKKYLDDNCGTKNYKICAYKDSLPQKADEFWWDNHSPLYKIGDWKGTKPEFNDIIHSIFTTPLYVKLYIVATLKQAVQQLVKFSIGDGNTPFPPGTAVNQRVLEYFPREIVQFNLSRQNFVSLWPVLVLPNRVFSGAVIIGLLVIICFCTSGKHISKKKKLLLLICFTGVLLNSLDCAAFSIVNGRYGCKMIWLAPFCAMILCIQFPGNFKTNIHQIRKSIRDSG